MENISYKIVVDDKVLIVVFELDFYFNNLWWYNVYIIN